jgi:uncharacterized membrane protein (DUF4010 family)
MLLANVAMMARNGLILAIFAPAALGHGWLAVGGMVAVTGWLVFRAMRRGRGTAAPEIRLAFPFSLRQALLFGALYLVLRGAVVLAERWLGTGGFLVVAFLGGLVSSASTTAAVATLAGQGRIGIEMAGMGVVLASMASLLFHVPMAWLGGLRGQGLRTLARLSALTALVGLLGLAAERMLR